jgi:hypothetical protein
VKYRTPTERLPRHLIRLHPSQASSCGSLALDDLFYSCGCAEIVVDEKAQGPPVFLSRLKETMPGKEDTHSAKVDHHHEDHLKHEALKNARQERSHTHGKCTHMARAVHEGRAGPWEDWRLRLGASSSASADWPSKSCMLPTPFAAGSGRAHHEEPKKGGAGKGAWGTVEDEIKR